MKNSLTILLVFLGFTVFGQNWAPTNLSAFNFLVVSDLEEHQGGLYSILFNAVSGDVHKLDPGGQSWTKLNTPAVTGIIGYLQSTGNRLYVGTYSFNTGMIYYSTDSLKTLIPDTVGLPPDNNGISRPFGLQYAEGKLIANLGSAGYYIKDTSSLSWTKFDVATLLNGGSDPVAYNSDTLYAFDNTGTKTFYLSSDQGSSFTVRNNNLPASTQVNLFQIDAQTGRFYIAGGITSNGITYSNYGIYYSDDYGFSWTKANLSSFIGTDVNGGQQEVTALYSSGNSIVVALENDSVNSQPDVLSTTTGINSLMPDTAGLIVDPAGTINGLHFEEFNNQIYVALNVRDVYARGISTGISIWNSEFDEKKIRVYPNPTRDYLHFDLQSEPNGKVINYRITNILGKAVLKGKNQSTQSISVQNLKPGTYEISFWNQAGFLGSGIFIKSNVN